jgi:hypothetical protein
VRQSGARRRGVEEGRATKRRDEKGGSVNGGTKQTTKRSARRVYSAGRKDESAAVGGKGVNKGRGSERKRKDEKLRLTFYRLHRRSSRCHGTFEGRSAVLKQKKPESSRQAGRKRVAALKSG